jgi:alpha-L-fucosidase
MPRPSIVLCRLLTIVVLGSSTLVSAEAEEPTLARPTPEQAAWQDLEVGMFIHFAPNTWNGSEGDDLSVPLAKINPEKLDTDQWVRVAQAMGAKYIVFVAKHVGGFCMWPTETTDYSIKSTPWRGGKGDVLGDLAASCRKAGMGLGVYLSPCDRKHGVGVGGRCATPEAQEAYNKLYRQQLTEVLTHYGELMEIWFDGSNIIPVGDLLKQHAPRAMVFQGPQATIRWVGTEAGYAPDPAWNSVISSTSNAKLGIATAADGNPDGDRWLPNEVDTVSVTPHFWFWNNRPERKQRSLKDLVNCYYRSVGHGAVLLLNQTPDTSGLIPEADALRAAEFGAEVRRRFGMSLAETKGSGVVVELPFGKPTQVDHVITMEEIREGERVRQYVVEAQVDGRWKEVCRGTAIGHKKIDQFKPVETSRLRLRIEKSAAEPIIRRFAAFYVGDPATKETKGE